MSCPSKPPYTGTVRPTRSYQSPYAKESPTGILQRGTPQMDGVPGVTQYPIAPGSNFTYRFKLDNEYGFYWYHSHFRAYYNDAIRGPITILPKRSRTRPFESLASCDADIETLLQAERDAFQSFLR